MLGTIGRSKNEFLGGCQSFWTFPLFPVCQKMFIYALDQTCPLYISLIYTTLHWQVFMILFARIQFINEIHFKLFSKPELEVTFCASKASSKHWLQKMVWTDGVWMTSWWHVWKQNEKLKGSTNLQPHSLPNHYHIRLSHSAFKKLTCHFVSSCSSLFRNGVLLLELGWKHQIILEPH